MNDEKNKKYNAGIVSGACSDKDSRKSTAQYK